MKRLELEMEAQEKSQERLQMRLSVLIADKNALFQEYHKRKLLADVERDKQREQRRIENLERETRDYQRRRTYSRSR